MRQVAKRFIFLLVVMFGCFALPGYARAENLQTLLDALNGTGTLNSLILSAASAGGVTATTVQSAIDGDLTALATIQAAIGGDRYWTYTITTCDFTCDTVSYQSYDGTCPGADFGSCQRLSSVMLTANQIAAGDGDQMLRTLGLAVEGNASATTVMQTLLGWNGSTIVTSGATSGAYRLSSTVTALIGSLGETAAAAANALFETADGSTTYAQDVNDALTAFSTVGAGALGSLGSSLLQGGTSDITYEDALDSDGDGIPDAQDTSMTDLDGDGVADIDMTDTDGDGTLDAYDPDVDGDGVANGIDPDYDTTGTDTGTDTMTDANGDGIPDGIASGTNTSSWTNMIPPMACVPTGASLTYVFAFNPCTWTRVNRVLLYALQYKGGVQVVNYLQSWWLSQFQPALKNMTAQLHASFLDQTRQLGSIMDSETITKAARVVQTKELEAKKRYAPSELACASGSYGGAMSQSLRTATALTQGFKFDMSARSGGASGQASARGALSDMAKNWQEYCQEFHDPASNNGVSACPSPTTAGTLVNGDIDIEGFLLKDTIDMAQPAQYKASLAMMRNLVEPKVLPRVDNSVIDTPAGREWVLKREHLEASRNIAVDVVASIISRRAAIPGANVGTTIKEIRVNAGVPDDKIAANPSYNEIMLAMTKERFFDPEYYVRMNGDSGAIKQEQAALEAYATVQLQDIYKLQEQINALLAARAALRFNADPLPERHEREPLK